MNSIFIVTNQHEFLSFCKALFCPKTFSYKIFKILFYVQFFNDKMTPEDTRFFRLAILDSLLHCMQYEKYCMSRKCLYIGQTMFIL